MLKARQKLGKYRIEKRLSDGPIAAVYQALDTIHATRVALKVPYASSMSEFYLSDFKREARLTARLDHPNILPIRDASYIDGRFVVAMPLGREALGDRMGRRLSTETALELAEQALASVAHAHRNKVIHCDIKPDNFILFPGNQLKLTDFAFSKIAPPRTIRASGSGTVGYIAPEQAVGRPMYQSDVFSLGLVIYELFSGYVPEWPYRWPPPGIARLRAKLKPKLVEWLRRAIEVVPKKRYKNAVVMYKEFKRFSNGSAKRKRRAKRTKSDDPTLWQHVLFEQFQRKYRKTLDTRYECKHCGGPIAEPMRACPWCGAATDFQSGATSFPAECPRCRRGAKLDWHYCAWCHGPGFEVTTSRRFEDRRYESHCSNTQCRGELMPFMRYCPWCRTKVKRAWKLPRGTSTCRSCRWGVDRDYWHHCPWCSKALEP